MMIAGLSDVGECAWRSTYFIAPITILVDCASNGCSGWRASCSDKRTMMMGDGWVKRHEGVVREGVHDVGTPIMCNRMVGGNG